MFAWSMKTVFFLIGVFSTLVLAITAVYALYPIVWPGTEFYVDPGLIDLVQVVAWPFVSIVFLAILLTSGFFSGGLSSFVERVSSLKLGDYEVSFSQDGARLLKRSLESQLTEFNGQSKIEYDRAARTHKIRDALKVVLVEIYRVSRVEKFPDADGIQQKDLKATVHVEDVVFEESFYQLIDYVPSGGGSGRRFSIRYGGIGITFRSGQSQVWNRNTPNDTEKDLIKLWGMTQEEASHSKQDGFAFCLNVAASAGGSAGVIFIKLEKDRCDESRLEEFSLAIESDVAYQKKIKELAIRLTQVHESLAPSGTYLRVYS